ncbi:MAG TPA: hypothetical protein VGM54_10175 [Chthoniobacter sp.]|jgi:hypothetical protein
MPKEKLSKDLSTSIPVRIPKKLEKQFREGVVKSGLSQQDLMRKSMEIGLPRLLRALEQAVSVEEPAAA